MGELIILLCLSTGGLDCELMLAVAKVESNLNPKAVGKSHGEQGLYQIRPEFHKCASFDAIENIDCAFKYMKKLKKRFHKKHGECYISFYNHGPNSKLKEPCKTNYYKKVNKRRNNG